MVAKLRTRHRPQKTDLNRSFIASAASPRMAIRGLFIVTSRSEKQHLCRIPISTGRARAAPRQFPPHALQTPLPVHRLRPAEALSDADQIMQAPALLSMTLLAQGEAVPLSPLL